MAECRVLAGNFAKLVQVLLGLISLGVLLCKFKRDHAGRTFLQFCLDSSKQLVSVGWLHILNAATAVILGHVTKLSRADECSWYWVEIMVDTTVGVYVEYLLLYCLPGWARGLTSGTYFDREGYFLIKSYGKQLAFWLFIVTLMKVTMVGLMIIGSRFLLMGASVLLSNFQQSPRLELLVVMVLTPAVMNSVQFWLVDNIFVHEREKASVDGCLGHHLLSGGEDASENSSEHRLQEEAVWAGGVAGINIFGAMLTGIAHKSHKYQRLGARFVMRAREHRVFNGRLS